MKKTQTNLQLPQHYLGWQTCKKIGPKPQAVWGKTWVIGWALIVTPKEVVEKNFEEVIFDKIKGPMQKEQRKRKKLIEKQR